MSDNDIWDAMWSAWSTSSWLTTPVGRAGRRCWTGRSRSGPTVSAFPRPAGGKAAGHSTTEPASSDPGDKEHHMTTTTMTWPGPEVVQASIERPTAMRLAQTEYQRVTDAVDALRPEDWSRPTDCTAWDVRQLVAHIAGQANLLSTPWEGARQMRAAQAPQQAGQP